MIFVTVGTTLWFDELIVAVDRFVENRQIQEHVVCQIGNGKYSPKNCEYFRFEKSIDTWINRASLVICHGGTGTVLQLITMRKPFFAVANSLGAHGHQSQFLSKLESLKCMLWCTDLETLPRYIQKAHIFKPRFPDTKNLTDDLIGYLEGS